MKVKDFLKELHRRNMWKLAVVCTAIAIAQLKRMGLEGGEKEGG